MHPVVNIARKELRAYFNSPLAYVFLVLFLGVTAYQFFGEFWARNQAELRGLFEGLPVLYLVLVPALTMRLWAEERKVGTQEMLLALPVRYRDAVLGKFFASFALMAIALALTAGLAMTVASLGDLDPGPVIGGYLGALLLGAAYLAIGQFASSLTDNQILAFLYALVFCFAFWLVGNENYFLRFWPADWVPLFQGLGTGTRFESIGRGVLDLRDLVYYASLAGFFLFINVGTLRARKWS